MTKKLCAVLAVLFLVVLSGRAFGQEDDPTVVLETTEGNVYIRLFPGIAPRTCENFLGLVRKHYYDNTIFHRVIKGFMIQGGDPTGTGTGGLSLWGGDFEDETSIDFAFDRPGMLAMANVGANTNKSQFFITTAPAPWLNMKHTIFGEVISGDDAVRVIEYADVDRKNKPIRPIRVVRAYVEGDIESDTARDVGVITEN